MKLSKLYNTFQVPLLLIFIMWLTKLAEIYIDANFAVFGIFPRKIESIKGILLAPFIHGDINHLYSNSIPLLVLSSAIVYFYKKNAYKIIAYCWILTGAAVWLGGRFSWHIGASGLVYAFASFLFFAGILIKKRPFIAISLLVVFLYGSMIWGIFPGKKGISWESHLFGFLSGFIFAFFFGKEYLPSDKKTIKVEKEDFVETSTSHKIDIIYFYKDN